MNKIKEKYMSLYEIDGVSSEYLAIIERDLQVKLPEDFREIAGYYSGGCMGYADVHSFRHSDPTNIIGETLRIRNAVGLPCKFVVISEQSESIIVMDTENNPSIIWLDSVEISKLGERNFISKPDTWNSFSDFFEQLLADEEDERSY